jgi:GT2 family glycosyltransferase
LTTLNARVSVIVTQRERFGMTSESLDSLVENTPGTTIIYVDGNSPDRWARYLREKADEGVIELIRLERYLTPNQARNIGVKAAETEFVAFVDNDVVFTEGWLDTLVQTADETGADIVAPLTCQGLPFHTEIHHAGGDYAANGDISGFFAASEDRAYKEVMHGHGKKVADLAGQLHRTETGMCEFHCVMARRDVFDRFGPLDEKLLSTKEHIDFSMTVRKNGGKVVFEPASVVTYVFPCRARADDLRGLAVLLTALVGFLRAPQPPALHREMEAADIAQLRRDQARGLRHAAHAGRPDPADAQGACAGTARRLRPGRRPRLPGS